MKTILISTSSEGLHLNWVTWKKLPDLKHSYFVNLLWERVTFSLQNHIQGFCISPPPQHETVWARWECLICMTRCVAISLCNRETVFTHTWLHEFVLTRNKQVVVAKYYHVRWQNCKPVLWMHVASIHPTPSHRRGSPVVTLLMCRTAPSEWRQTAALLKEGVIGGALTSATSAFFPVSEFNKNKKQTEPPGFFFSCFKVNQTLKCCL